MKQPSNGLCGPHLVDYRKNYSGSVCFLKLPESGEISIGSPTKRKTPDVVIDGVNVKPLHAVIKCSSGRSIFVPYGISSIDGIRCNEPSVLKSGSMICLGRSNYFKFFSPCNYEEHGVEAIDCPHGSNDQNIENVQYEISYQDIRFFELPLSLNPAFLPCMFQCEYEALMTYFTTLTFCIADLRFTVNSRCISGALHEFLSQGSCISQQETLCRLSLCIDDVIPFYSVLSCSTPRQRFICRCSFCYLLYRKLEEDSCVLPHQSSQLSSFPLTKCSSSPPNVWKSPKQVIGKPAFSPSQNRIKTNGSLSKEMSASRQHSSLFVTSSADCSQSELDSLPRSPRTGIRTTLSSPKPLESSRNSNHSGYGSDVAAYLEDVIDSGAREADKTCACGMADCVNSCGLSSASLLTREFISLSNEICSENIGRMIGMEESAASTIGLLGSAAGEVRPAEREGCARLYDQLKREKLASYQRISALIQRRIQLEHDEREEVASVDMEYRLLTAEVQACLEQIDTLNSAAEEKQHRLSERQQQWHQQRGLCSVELTALSDQLTLLEDQLTRSTSEQHETASDLRSLRETVEQTRKLHEDKEFVHMELEASWEADKEELSSDLIVLAEQIECWTRRLQYFRDQQKFLVETIRSECEEREATHQDILQQMCAERDRLRSIRTQFTQLARALAVGTGADREAAFQVETLVLSDSALDKEQRSEAVLDIAAYHSIATCGDCASPTSSSSSRPVSGSCSVFEQNSTEGVSLMDGGRVNSCRREKTRGAQQRPLTRYMPVLHERLDLCAHVESAAHQPELFSAHVAVTPTACRGYLHKLGGRLRAWQRRWFVFDRSAAVRALLYYSDSAALRPRGGAHFTTIQEVYVNHGRAVRGAGSGTTFCVKTRARTFQLMAPSAPAMRVWVDVIMTGAEGYLTLCRE